MTALNLPAIEAARERLLQAKRAAYHPQPGEDPIAALPELAEAERAVLDAVLAPLPRLIAEVSA